MSQLHSQSAKQEDVKAPKMPSLVFCVGVLVILGWLMAGAGVVLAFCYAIFPI